MQRIIMLLITLLITLACTDGEVIDRRSFDSTASGAQDENLSPKNTDIDEVPGGDILPEEEGEGVGDIDDELEKEADKAPEGKAIGEITDESAEGVTFAGLSAYANYVEASSIYSMIITETKVSGIKEFQCVECEGDDDASCVDCTDAANKDNEACFCYDPANSSDEKCAAASSAFLTVNFMKPFTENDKNITNDAGFPTVEKIEVSDNPSSTTPGLTSVSLMKDGKTYNQIDGSTIEFTKLPTKDDTSYEASLDLKLRQFDITDPLSKDGEEITYKGIVKGDVNNVPAVPEECNTPGKNGKKAVVIYSE